MIPSAKKVLKKIPLLKAGVEEARHQASRRRVNAILRGAPQIFVELGAGEKKGAGGWVTVDVSKHCDLYWDLRRGLPFPDESVAGIYSSHFLEHLTFREAGTLLAECRRVLVPGGFFSVCVPNARLYIDAYLQPAADRADALLRYTPARNGTTAIDFLNYIAYMDGHHKYMFDEENLVHILTANGFRNARLRPFDAALDRPERREESIYAVAQK